MNTTFKKALNWGESDSYAKFEVKGFVLGDAQVHKWDGRTAFRHEFSDFGQTGPVTLRPTGHGTLNFEIAAEYRLARRDSLGNRREYKGEFRYRYWIDYNFEKGDKDPMKLDFQDLFLDDQLHQKMMYEKGDGKFRLTGAVPAAKDGSTKAYTPYFTITPQFEIAPISDTTAHEDTTEIGGGVNVGKGERGLSGNVSKSFTDSKGTTVNPPSPTRVWGHLRLDLHVLEIVLPSVKPPKQVPKLTMPVAPFVVIPFKHDQRKLSDAAKEIASAWKRQLFQSYPELQQAIRDRVVRVYFDGYASKDGSEAYNYQIGTDRAAAAIDWLAPQLGLMPADISNQTFGEEKSKWGTAYDETVKKNVEKVGKPRDVDLIVIAYLNVDDLSKVLNKRTSH